LIFAIIAVAFLTAICYHPPATQRQEGRDPAKQTAGEIELTIG